VDEDIDLERFCIVTREVRDPARLIRFVRAPDGMATPDLKRKLPGRGCWVAAESAVMARATAKAFSRAFRAESEVPDDLAGMVERLLRQDALQALALANKAGCVVTGHDKVAAALAAGRVVAILHATEAADNGRRKLNRSGRGNEAIIAPFSSAEMDLALGRIHVIHAALTVGAVSDACLVRCRFLLTYRGENGNAMRAGEATDDDTGEASGSAGSKAE
jgi:predicted RNA-binding protein YlxR (DUF448 family)